MAGKREEEEGGGGEAGGGSDNSVQKNLFFYVGLWIQGKECVFICEGGGL